MKAKKVIALVIAAAFAAPVAAQSGSGTVQPKDSNPAAAPKAFGGGVDRSGAGASASGFAAMDRNNDGYISRDEARDASWSNRFTELDKDNDGRLSASEFEAMQGAASGGRDANSPSTTGGMGGSVGPGGTQSGSSTSGIGDKPGQKQ
jgi:hypothetical protein